MDMDTEEGLLAIAVLLVIALLAMPVVGFVAYFGVWLFKLGWGFASALAIV